MDFRKILEGKKYSEFEAIGENWYSRLNKLKDKYGEPINGIENKKAEKIIYELISRLSIYAQLYARAMQPKPRYAKGR